MKLNVDSSKKKVSEAFGITSDRLEVISTAVDTIFRKNVDMDEKGSYFNVSKTIAEIAEVLDTPEEMAYIIYFFGKSIAKQDVPGIEVMVIHS